jgi:hypothetical protein
MVNGSGDRARPRSLDRRAVRRDFSVGRFGSPRDESRQFKRISVIPVFEMRHGSLGASVNGRLGAFFARNSAHALQDKLHKSGIFHYAFLISFFVRTVGVMSGVLISALWLFWGSTNINFSSVQESKIPHVSQRSEDRGRRGAPKQSVVPVVFCLRVSTF